VDLKQFVRAWYARYVSLAAAGIDEHLSRSLFVLEHDGGFSPAASAAVERIFNHYSATRVLTQRRVSRMGSEALNSQFHSLFTEGREPAHG